MRRKDKKRQVMDGMVHQIVRGPGLGENAKSVGANAWFDHGRSASVGVKDVVAGGKEAPCSLDGFRYA